jgi:thiol-disulfide isomerase/thioredoxin
MFNYFAASFMVCVALLIGSLSQADEPKAKPSVVVFSASWCGPCQAFKRDLKGNKTLRTFVATDIKTIHICDVDTAEGKRLQKAYGMRSSIPGFAVGHYGDNGFVVTRRFYGYKNPSGFINEVKKE